MEPINPQIALEIAERYKINVRGSQAHNRAVGYTPEQIREIVGNELSVKINFVPQMMTAVVMDLATEFINHCRDYRVEEAKKPNRLMRRAVEVYTERLYEHYGKAATAAYISYVQRYMSEIRTDIWLLRLKLSELVANQMPHIKDREVPILACCICGISTYIEMYDAEMDKMLESMLKQPVKCSSNKFLDVVKALCVDIATKMDCRIQVDGQVSDWITILGNRGLLLAEKILKEEETVDKR